ncbi:unnamed protein product [Sympodiomycopsis kandeliae]
MTANPISQTNSNRTPVWFIAHGGPPTVLDYDSSARKHWIKIASEIKDLYRNKQTLKGIVFVSAHWQAESSEVSNNPDGILVNNDATNPLIYDFYGFPREFYQLQFKTENPSWLNQLVSSHLNKEGFQASFTKRGLDHGVWVPLLPGFGADGQDLPPLTQISLPFSQEDQGKNPVQDGLRALRLGRALRALRDQGIAVIGGGQPVHNLREMMRSRSDPNYQQSDFAQVFGDAVKDALSPPGKNASIGGQDKYAELAQGEPQRWEAALDLFDHKYFKRSHPTAEHLLPALVCLGAAHDEEAGNRTFREEQLTMDWSMFRWE